MRRPGAVGLADGSPVRRGGSGHPLGRVGENEKLYAYERNVKDAFDSIVPTLKQISAVQHVVGCKGTEFVVVQHLQQGVEKHNTFVAAKAREICITVG